MALITWRRFIAGLTGQSSTKEIAAAVKHIATTVETISASILDNTPGGTNGDVIRAATSNIVYDHGVATTAVHGVGAGTIAKIADITGTKLDDLTAPDDNTDLNVSVTSHGLSPKLNNVSTYYLSGTGVWSVPSIPAAGTIFYMDGGEVTDTNNTLVSFDLGGV
uniref:Uncharacterized protein n=1 Tax=viral metagenome TaxID=1070528 RepID=A0A6M3K0V9_9ZZZZ